MEGARGMVGQSLYASQAARGTFGMLSQNLSGNRHRAPTTARFVKFFPAGASGGTLASFGIQANDFMLMGTMSGSNPPGTLNTGSTSLGSDGGSVHYYKEVDAADVAQSFTFPSLSSVLFYRGPKRAVLAASYNGPVSVWCGFEKTRNHIGLVGQLWGPVAGGPYNPDTAESSFTSRGTSSGAFDLWAWDRLALTGAPYAGGQFFSTVIGGSTTITALELLSV